MALEEEFEMEIPDEEAEKISTVADAVNYIKANSSKNGTVLVDGLTLLW